MTITLNTDYDVALSTALLGYVGETNARPVSVEGLTVDGADRYVLTIDYGDGVTYEVDITGGTWTPTADILRSAQTVSCQICAKKLSGNEYILLKKSRIFRLRIGAAIGDNAVPSPSVAADALDRISAIGEQVEADVERAENAASTAMQAAENAKKSATNAEKSADTAEQAASRAETAKAAAETSTTQANTAMQGAETARQQAVTAQNAAKISAAQASASAQQTEADKTITAGYAKTAKTNADSTAADRQAVQTLATQVTADKATVAENAAKVAEDRTAAETAAQTAQAVADSLPEDYTTAVGKIAENTAEIGRVKMSDKELKRRVDALYSIGQGITHRFETDSETAYAKTIPTGGKLMSVKNVGGKSVVWNQMIPDSIIHVTVTIDEDVTVDKWISRIEADTSNIISAHGHKVLGKCVKDASNPTANVVVRFGDNNANISNGYESEHSTEKGIYTLQSSVKNGALYYRAFAGAAAGTYGFTLQLYDLTAMFGSGSEPSTVEEFEKIFPAAYYPYNAGEIVSAETESVVEQGKNLFDKSGKENSDAYTIPMYYNGRYKGLKIPCENGDYTVSTKHKSGYTLGMSKAVYVIDTEISTDNNITGMTIEHSAGYGYNVDKTGTISVKNGYIILSVYFGDSTTASRKSFFDLCDIQIEKSSTATAYAPYHSNVYQIPEAIKALPGYGIEGNVVDYEAKTYTQNNTVDGTEVKALATPIVTDISTLIPDDFLRNIEVESGGSITFKNSNGDSYRIPVPSEEEYIVKLSEIGGNV